MGSVAEALDKDGSLAASFFFSATSSNVNRRFKQFFIPTLAYQLAQHPTLRGFLRLPILGAVHNHPELSETNLSSQAEILLLGPIRQVLEEVDPADWPKAIVVDGIDECRVEHDLAVTTSGRKRTNGDEQLEVLRVLSKLALDPSFPFRILIASRPDPAIHDYFEDEGREKVAVTVLDDTYSPDKDIALYLEAMFADIRRRYNLDANWPAPNVVPTLVMNASGHFAYPSGAMKIIDDEGNLESPVSLLEIVMGRASSPLSPQPGSLAPLGATHTDLVRSNADPAFSVTLVITVNHVKLAAPASLFFFLHLSGSDLWSRLIDHHQSIRSATETKSQGLIVKHRHRSLTGQPPGIRAPPLNHTRLFSHSLIFSTFTASRL